jgi:dephospho-CoA kinase
MKIGVTGIFASGKGTVCKMFEELGAKVIDTDELAREVQMPGSKGLAKIEKSFGREMINTDGTLNRRKLANDVFIDPEKVKKLNSIIHPLIHARMREIIKKNPEQMYMINVPLLFESGFYRDMDYTITVTAAENQAIDRGIIRDNITEKEIKERIKNQISLNEKIKLSDYVIDNSGSILNTKRQVLEIWTNLHQERTGE